MAFRSIAWLTTCVSVLFACGGASKPAQPTALLATGAPAVATEGGPSADADSPVAVSPADPSWGSPTALVTLVVFSDFQCPFCARVEPTLAQVRQTYGPEKVRIVWKNEPLPFHDHARPAAEAAMGVFALGGNDAFWKMHDKIFANQRDLSPESYEKWAGESGVDVAALRAGIAAHSYAKKIDEDHQLAKLVGVNGTPGAFANGVEISGAQPFAYFQAIIDEQLEKAEAKAKAGTPKGQLYAMLTRENFKSPAQRKPDDDDDEHEDTTTVFAVPIGKSPVRGSASALVTIVEFSDFQCPFCKRVQPTLKQIESTYGDKVRIVWKDEPLPFHPLARRAATFAREARAQKGDVGFWAAHDKLFELAPAIDKPDLESAAPLLGLNLAKVQAAAKTEKYKGDIEADMALADDVQASGTPHFFINGRRLTGAQPFEKFKVVIDEEITKSQAAIAAGTPAAKLYDAIVAKGKGPPPPETKKVAAPTGSEPSRGPAKAKVTVTVFGDFQCPFCGRAEATLEEVHKTYGDKVRIVARDLPLPMHPNAPLAAEAAREAFAQKGNAGYWKMRAALFADQKKLERQDLEAVAQKEGLDMTKFRAALDSHVHKAAVDADAAAAATAEIHGTPNFLVNDYVISGAQPFPKFKKLIDRALAESK